MASPAHRRRSACRHKVRNFRFGARKPITRNSGSTDNASFETGSLDLFLSYWMGHAIAHAIMKLRFEGERYLEFSIELRRTGT